MITVAVTADKPVRDITEFADKILRRRLESSDGVGQVVVIGGRSRQLNLWLDTALLRAQKLSVNDVARALQSQNADIPGGRMDQGAQSVTLRTRGRLEIDRRVRRGGAARSRRATRFGCAMSRASRTAWPNRGRRRASTASPPCCCRSASNPAPTPSRSPTTSSSASPICRQSCPPGYQLRIVRDEAQFIEASIASVQEHLIVGSILAAIVVWLFLGNFRSTVIAAISIPTSIIATFALVWYMGFTLNMLTMLALTLSVGIVIDDAIVVLENIFRFIEEKGMPPMQAAVEATNEIGLAVMATTLSLVAIFAPVGFMSGMVGRFMQSFGLTMAFAVMVSLFVSFTLTPMMSAYWLRPQPKGAHRDSKHNRLFDPLDRGYTRLLDWAMAHRGLVAVGAVLVLLSSVPLFRFTAVNFTPEDDQSQFDVTMRAPEGTSLASMEVLANRVSTRRATDSRSGLHAGHGGRRCRRHLEHRQHVGSAASNRGAATAISLPSWRKFANKSCRTMPRRGFEPPCSRAAARAAAAAAPSSSWCRAPISKQLEKYSEQLRAKALTIPGLVDVDTTLNAGKPEISVLLDRPKAADLGVSIADAADAIRLLVAGDQVTTFNDGGEQYEVHLRAEEVNRSSTDAIAGLPVPSSRLGIVSLDNIASFKRGDSPATISRMGRQRQVTLSREHAARHVAGHRAATDRGGGGRAEFRTRVSCRFCRPFT